MFRVLTQCFRSVLTHIFRFLPDVLGQFLPVFSGSFPMFRVSSYLTFWVGSYPMFRVLTQRFGSVLTQIFGFLPDFLGWFLPAWSASLHLGPCRVSFGTACPSGIPPAGDLLMHCPKSSSSNTVVRGKLDIPFPFQNVDVGFLFLQSCA